MFTKKLDEAEAADDAGSRDSRDLKLAACGPGIRSIAQVGRKLHLMTAIGLDSPPTLIVLPLPTGGRVVALHSDGPSAVTADGALHHWVEREERWARIGNLFDAS